MRINVSFSMPLAALTNARIFSWSFLPGALSTLTAELMTWKASARPSARAVRETLAAIAAALGLPPAPAARGADPRFVGGHPIAGAETAGVEHARADLFQGAVWYLTPHEQSGGLLYERLHRFVRDVGARPVAVDAATHDRLVAVFSHLPHVLANVLASQAAARLSEHGEALRQVGPSFRDMTRVAGANTAMWSDIYRSNAAAIVEEIRGFRRELDEVERRLAEGEVEDWNDRAREDRRALLEAGAAEGPVHELRLTVPNRPGIVAQVALELGRAGVNIVDMALAPASDMRTGAMSLWIAGDAQAQRASELISGLGFPVGSE